MISRLLFLQPGQLRRAGPFFALYLLLFAVLTLADGLSLTLFVSRVGAEQLPRFQALAALCVMVMVGWYLRGAARCDNARLFGGILLGPLVLFFLVWLAQASGAMTPRWWGLLFLGREVALALVLLHFGAFLQDYFSRAELNRVMPVIYAGGRVGGIAGGAVLEHASPWVAPGDLLLLLALLLGLALAGVRLIAQRIAKVEEESPLPAPASVAGGGTAAAAFPAREPSDVLAGPAPTLGAFAIRVWRSPLLFWITVSTAALFFCRAGLTLQCGFCLEREFGDEATLARFLGRYSQIALAVSLVLQLVVVNRLVSWTGLRGAQGIYAGLIVLAAAGGWGGMTLAAAMFARFVEGELRYGLRNPVAQMTVNLFPKSQRTQARAWSLGMLIPVATLVASLVLELLLGWEAFGWVAVVTLGAGLAYAGAILGLSTTIVEPRTERSPPAERSSRVRPAPGPA